jgi:hypothetical protein
MIRREKQSMVFTSVKFCFLLQCTNFHLPCSDWNFLLDLATPQGLRLQPESLSNNSRVYKILTNQIFDSFCATKFLTPFLPLVLLPLDKAFWFFSSGCEKGPLIE